MKHKIILRYRYRLTVANSLWVSPVATVILTQLEYPLAGSRLIRRLQQHDLLYRASLTQCPKYLTTEIMVTVVVLGHLAL